jgi:hypothetical protein
VSEAVSCYREFDFAAKYYRSPFWQFFHSVRLAAFPGELEARRRVLWTNLVKFVGRDGSRILKKPYAEQALRLQEDVLVTELAIAKPDICVFVTGPDYDGILERYFDGVRFEPLDLPVRQFARLVATRLPHHSYRTYHPNALRRLKMWDRVVRILGRELSWPSLAPHEDEPLPADISAKRISGCSD